MTKVDPIVVSVDLREIYTDPVACARTAGLALSIPGAEGHVLQHHDYRMRIPDSVTVYFSLDGRRYFIGHGGTGSATTEVNYKGEAGQRCEQGLERGFIIGRAPETADKQRKSFLPIENYFGPEDRQDNVSDPIPQSLQKFLFKKFPGSKLAAMVKHGGAYSIWDFDGESVDTYLREGVAISHDMVNEFYRGLQMLVPEEMRMPNGIDDKWIGYYLNVNRTTDWNLNRSYIEGKLDNWEGFVYTGFSPRVGYSPVSGVLWLSVEEDQRDHAIETVETRAAHANPSKRRELKKLDRTPTRQYPDSMLSHLVGEGDPPFKIEGLEKKVCWFDIPIEDITSLAKLNKSDAVIGDLESF